MRLHVRGINTEENIGRGHYDKSVSSAHTGTSLAHYSSLLQSPPSIGLLSFFMPSNPPPAPPPSAATSGYRRAKSMTCALFSLLLHTNLLAQSSWVHKPQDRPHMAKRCFLSSFSSVSHHKTPILPTITKDQLSSDVQRQVCVTIPSLVLSYTGWPEEEADRQRQNLWPSKPTFLPIFVPWLPENLETPTSIMQLWCCAASLREENSYVTERASWNSLLSSTLNISSCTFLLSIFGFSYCQQLIIFTVHLLPLMFDSMI